MIVIAKISGGLGNQFFQYAAARAVCRRLGASLYLDTSWFARMRSTPAERQYVLDHYNIEARRLSDLITRPLLHVERHVFRRLPGLRPWRLIKEAGVAYDGRIFEGRTSRYLDGYWGRHDYFDSIRDTLRKELTLVRPHAPTDYEGLIVNSESVAVHVRRGDYLTSTALRPLPLSYYEEAMEALHGKVPGPTFFVFSDDLAWVKEAFPRRPGVTIVENSRHHQTLDLHLMTLCRHQIIANSTFSWWAAYLNDNREKIVVAPSSWLQGEPACTAEDYPAGWVLLQTPFAEAGEA